MLVNVLQILCFYILFVLNMSIYFHYVYIFIIYVYIYIYIYIYICLNVFFFSWITFSWFYFFVNNHNPVIFLSGRSPALTVLNFISMSYMSSFWINNTVWCMITPPTCPPFSFSDTSYWKHEQFALLTWQQHRPCFCWHYLFMGNSVSYYRCAEMYILTLFTLKDHKKKLFYH